ncbi:MAG: PEP-CTERM sorting domain-containing protein, partial [Myxococcota bacterium]
DSWSDSDEAACGTDPLLDTSAPADTDGDLQCDVVDDDDDGDGFSDAAEIAEGSDPLDASSIPVPEPASTWLALAALMTLLGLRRRQKRLLAHDRRAGSGSTAG